MNDMPRISLFLYALSTLTLVFSIVVGLLDHDYIQALGWFTALLWMVSSFSNMRSLYRTY